MKAPDFWSRDGAAAALLAPVSRLYAAAVARRIACAPKIVPGIPVICVGNLTVGGTGKTPAAIEIVRRLAASGLKPAIILRGYGGSVRGPVGVDPSRHSAAEVGDEALLVAAFAPTFIARDRARAAGMAEGSGCNVIVMDDGFQNSSVAKNLSIVVVDAETGFGNGRVLPAGPLREPVRTGLSRADLVLLIGPDAARRRFLSTWRDRIDVPILEGHLAPIQTGMDWRGLRVTAFAGIGRPAKFFATLEDLGADVVGRHALDDHQPLGNALMRRLVSDATATSSQLVTTEKDAVRLPPDMRRSVVTLPVRLQIDDWASFDALFERIGRDEPHGPA